MEPPTPEGGESLVPSPTGPSSPAVPPADDRHAQRWRLVRNLAVFQLKLLIDGLKDLVLSPVALVAGLIGLLAERDRPEQHFEQVMQLGHSFDRWLDLFGTRASHPPALPAADAPPPHTATPTSTGTPPQQGLDAYISRVEQVLAEQVQRGGLTTKTKDAIDRALDSLHGRTPPR